MSGGRLSWSWQDLSSCCWRLCDYHRVAWSRSRARRLDEEPLFPVRQRKADPMTGTTRPLLAITMGDPAGIGPEVVLKALAHADVFDRCRPLVIGDRRILERAAGWLGQLPRARRRR